MQNSEFILTKNRVIEKINEALGGLFLRMQFEVRQRQVIYDGFEKTGAKISKGEKYMGLPYLILDYPRLFDRENILAIRTFFWWGSFCSITLHVKGKYQALVSKRLLANFHRYTGSGYYLSISGDEWCHNVHAADYTAIASIGAAEFEGALADAQFVKLSVKVGFGQWDEIEARLFDHFLVLLELMEA